MFNAVIGLRQEAARESVKALAQMMKTIAQIGGRPGAGGRRREAVPGDVVLMEAGNRVPADGRVCVAATLEIEEGPLGLAPDRGRGPVTVPENGGMMRASGSILRSVGCARCWSIGLSSASSG